MNFASQLLGWFAHAGRKTLPWQQELNPYRVWVSEIMLQQTQVNTVIPYYQRFMHRFPNIETLARAPVDEVLKFWAGLGYYARGRNLHKTAQLIVREFQGEFPKTAEILKSFPGIGASTAHAILAIAYGQRLPILDGNVKRVLTRFKGITEYPGLPKTEKALWTYAESLLPESHMPAYTQAIMDLGAMICTQKNPSCLLCPISAGCYAFIHQMTERIPQAKPKRAYPHKQQICLVLYNPEAQVVFLEQRPPSGIWGGLQVPLFFDDEAQLTSWAQQQNLSLDSAKNLPLRVHKFTHFQLNFQPRLQMINTFHHATLKPCSLNDLSNLALPAPVKTLLQDLKYV
jgi:A/G-specific adenine glycosylase